MLTVTWRLAVAALTTLPRRIATCRPRGVSRRPAACFFVVGEVKITLAIGVMNASRVARSFAASSHAMTTLDSISAIRSSK